MKRPAWWGGSESIQRRYVIVDRPAPDEIRNTRGVVGHTVPRSTSWSIVGYETVYGRDGRRYWLTICNGYGESIRLTRATFWRNFEPA